MLKHLHMEVLSAPPLPRLCNLTAREGSTIKRVGVTVEKPWLDNKPYKSCVPAGEYELVEHQSPSKNKWCGGRVLVLKNLLWGVGVFPGEALRNMCQMHSANFPIELEGCIGPGLAFHSEKWGVVSSRKACKLIFNYFDKGFNRLVIE